MRFRRIPKDRTGRHLRAGDLVRIVGVPSLKGMSATGIAESLPVLRYLKGKSVRIDSFNDIGLAWLNFAIPAGKYKGWHGVAIESRLLERRPNTSLERTREG